MYYLFSLLSLRVWPQFSSILLLPCTTHLTVKHVTVCSVTLVKAGKTATVAGSSISDVEVVTDPRLSRFFIFSPHTCAKGINQNLMIIVTYEGCHSVAIEY